MNGLSKQKVLFVITKANWGGAQRYVYDLATASQDAGYQAQVIYGEPGILADKLIAQGIPATPIPSLTRDVGLLQEGRALRSLVRFFRTSQPDIVHLNSSKASGLGALAARFAGVPRIIFTAHGWPFEERREFAWRALALLGSWATALLSHTIIVVSMHDLKIGKRMPLCGSKMHLIHNGIELPIQLGIGAVIRDSFPLGAHITGTIGELNKNKNQITLIEQARGNPEMFVAIVGEGEERANLEEKIQEYALEDRVKLFGFLPAREVLRGFDTFALPSTKEGLPYVLLEAKAAGLPLIANRVGGIGEILDAKDMSPFSLERMIRETFALYR